MTTIVTRAGKGSALTWTEGDSNFTNLNTAKLENISEDLTPTLGGNLDLNDKTLSKAKVIQANADGLDIKNVGGDNLIRVGIAGANYCTINADIIKTISDNQSISIQPHGTGDISLIADTVTVGDVDTAAIVTTNGTGNLTLSTNSGTNSGTILINQGTNGNITLTPNGTGNVTISGGFIGIRTNSTLGSLIGRNQTTTSGAYQYPALMAQKTRTDILTAAMTVEPATVGFSVRDSASVNTNFGRFSCVYQGTGSNPFFRASVSVDGFTNNLDAVIFGVGTAQWGNTTGGYTHTTPGAGNLTLSTNNGTNSGTIVITNGVNGAITLTPNGTGKVVLGTDVVNIAETKTPATSGATGTTGDIAWDADYIYVCTATNTWKRAGIATW